MASTSVLRRSSFAQPCPHRAQSTHVRSHKLAIRPVRVLASGGRSSSEPHLQLGTAKLPGSVSVPGFANYLYQWAATLTQSGSNLPFILPIKADKLEDGFKISLLKRGAFGNFDSAGDIQANVEAVGGEGNILFIRFYEGPAALLDRQIPGPSDSKQRLEIVLQSLPDVTILMRTLPNAIRSGIAANT